MQDDPTKFFGRQTIFLTGGTGGLGGCLLFKLALKVEAQKIYVIVRESEARARAQWAKSMPDEIEAVLSSGKVQLVIGDVTQENCGLDPSILAEMGESVTLIIHAAASISLTAPLRESIDNNCLPALRLAELATSRFTNLAAFVYVSSAYANSFLPDGVVEERIYEVGDAEHQLSEILTTGSVSQENFPHFPWPYAASKHITERLLLSRHPALPLLIVRPTIIAPAISQPHPYYAGTCPLSTYIRQYMQDPDSGVIRVSPRHISGSNIVDEIPVDLVSNLLLLHVAQGTTGIAHAGSQSYVPRSLAQLHHTIVAQMRTTKASAFRYVTDAETEEGRHNRFWRVFGRDWHFSNAASRGLTRVRGALNMDLDGHDATNFMEMRARLIAMELEVASRSKL